MAERSLKRRNSSKQQHKKKTRKILILFVVSQDRVIAFWFPDRLEMVFSSIVCVIRLGSVSNFLASSNMAEYLGLQMAAWIGM